MKNRVTKLDACMVEWSMLLKRPGKVVDHKYKLVKRYKNGRVDVWYFYAKSLYKACKRMERRFKVSFLDGCGVFDENEHLMFEYSRFDMS